MASTSTPTSTFSIAFDDGVEVEVEAVGLEAAREEARERILSGQWNVGPEDSTFWARARVQRAICPEDGERGCDCPRCAGEVVVAIDPEEPVCEEGHDHDWVAPVEVVGGIEDNPGVQGNGGGVVYETVCLRSGARRVQDTWAQDLQTGEEGLESVQYSTLPTGSTVAYWVRHKPACWDGVLATRWISEEGGREIDLSEDLREVPEALSDLLRECEEEEEREEILGGVLHYVETRA